MIVFTIVYGPDYPRMFFERTLPSLLTANNLPRVRNEPFELVLCTLSHEVGRVRELVQQYKKHTSFFGSSITVVSITVGFEINDQASKFRASHLLLCMAVAYCLRKNSPFLHAVADLVYSDGSIDACWALHRLTGKVVALFNGRIEPLASDEATNELVNNAVTVPTGILELFLSRMAKQWRDSITQSAEFPPVETSEPVLLMHARKIFIFNASPNPTIGKFTHDDLAYLSNRIFQAWDHAWRDMLARTERLLPLTDIDMGMSVEIESLARYNEKEAGITRRKNPVGHDVARFTEMVNAMTLDAAPLPMPTSVSRQPIFSHNLSSVCFTSTALERSPEK